MTDTVKAAVKYHRRSWMAWILFLLTCSAAAQSTASAVPVVPTLMNFSGTIADVNGKPVTGVLGVTFYLYKDSEGGAPLWMETQNVQPDRTGHYSVTLGSTTSAGLPTDLFASGEARWLAVQPQGQAEQPRVLLLSVPYALKASDAQTIGGLPPSAFMLAPLGPGNPASGTQNNGTNVGTTAAVVGSGTPDFIPLWTSNSILGNSLLFQSGTGDIGINTTTPAATLDVNGGVISRGSLQLPSTGTASAGAGFTSQPLLLQGSSFNSSTKTAISPLFQWQTEPSGNNTSTPAGTLNLLYGSGSGSPAETGLNISSNGQITFAKNQTFPGAGTITGITTATGSGLTGGGTSGTLNLTLTNSCAANQVLQWNGTTWACSSVGAGTISGVTAGTDLTGGGTSGNVTLNLDTTKIPQLNSANTFTGLQTISVNSGNEALNVTQQAVGGQTYAIIGTNSSAGNRSAAILGQSFAGSGIVFGVEGYIADNDGAGVFGSDGNPLSQTGGSLSGTFGSGVWGDGSGAGLGIIGTTDNNTAIAAYNNSSTASAIQGWNENTTNSTSALAPGVFGLSFAPKGIGVIGSGPVHSSTFSSSAGQFAYGVVGDGGPSTIGIGVGGMADTGAGVAGWSKSSGTGVWGSSQEGNGVFGASSTGAGTSGQSSTGDGIYGTSLNGAGIYGVSLNANGVYGEGQDGNGSGGAGVYAFGQNTAAGVFSTTSGTGAAVVGINNTSSGEASSTAYLLNAAPFSGIVLYAGGSTTGAWCDIQVAGNLTCSGDKSVAVPTPDQHWVKLYSVESPENWFEDFGSGNLESGRVIVQLEPNFRETVNPSLDYHVFLTPRGECEGLYVASMTANSFEVRELHHGKSSVPFDYRIVAKRKDYENIRMEDVTATHDRQVIQVQDLVKQSQQLPSLKKKLAGPAQPQGAGSISTNSAVLGRRSDIPAQVVRANPAFVRPQH